MNLIEVIFLAIALGVDCMVVSFSQGLIFNRNRVVNSIKLAAVMGFFQGFMPIIGYGGAEVVSNYVERYSEWIVFGIFFILGCKFIYEAFEQREQKVYCIGLHCLISMGIATSIDALVAGMSLRFSGAELVVPILIIGLVSFIMSLSGFWLGNCFKKFPSNMLEVMGGVILIILGLRGLV